MSGNPAHIQENAEVFDFSLTKSEMQQMVRNVSGVHSFYATRHVTLEAITWTAIPEPYR